jgi:chromosomal replication initiator protein
VFLLSNDVLELWSQTVSYLKQRNGNNNSKLGTFLGYLTPKALSDSEVVVSTDNAFAKDWIERNYTPSIKDAIFNVAGIDYSFRIVVAEQEGSFTPAYQQPIPDALPVPEQKTDNLIDTPVSTGFFASSLEQVEKKKVIVSDERTFESFVVGDSNQYAFSAALGVAKSPGNIYNPLFIYGNSGLGKTHLLLAIENYIKSNQPHLRTSYAQTTDFVRDFTNMLYSEEKRREFDFKYRQVDVILLDDVQYLEGKVETTGEVFQIFNYFISQNKQIILSADRAPYDIDLDARYKSRFSSGPTMDIQPPSFETKRAIFENYLDYSCRRIGRPELKELVSPVIVDRIIDLSSDNIRELEGATASLVAYLSARPNMIDSLTIEDVEQRVANVFMRSEAKRINIVGIQQEVESFYKISHDDLISKKRSQGISYPRQVAMYLSRSMTGASLPDIGKAFGGKDHTTVMYACNQIEKKRQLIKETNKEIEHLVALIKK